MSLPGALLAVAIVVGPGSGAEDVAGLLVSGEYTTAEARAREWSRLAAEGDRAEALTLLARALAANGALIDGEAERTARQAFELASGASSDSALEVARARLGLAAVALARGQAEEARTEATVALEGLASGVGTAADRADALALIAAADIDTQRFDEALAAVGRGLQDLPEPALVRAWVVARLRDQEALAQLYKGNVAAGHLAAETALRERDALWSRHPDSINTEILLAYADTMGGRDDESAGHARRAVEIGLLALRPGHPLLAHAQSMLAAREADAGLYDTAFERHRAALAAARASLGPFHPQVLGQLNDFADTYYNAGDLPAAEALFEEALAATEMTLGPESLAAATLAFNLAVVHGEAGHWPMAEASLARALTIWHRTHGELHVHIALALHQWARLLGRQGKDEAAVGYFERALAMRIRLSGEDHPLVAEIRTGLAGALERLGRREASERAAGLAEPMLASTGGWRDEERSRLLALQARLRATRGDTQHRRPIGGRVLPTSDQPYPPQRPLPR